MPVVKELFGQVLDEDMASSACRSALCPFLGDVCDGGGNRDMARVAASSGGLFDCEVGRRTQGRLSCGICSIETPKKKEVWAICSRRLLAFSSNGVADRHRELASRVFALCGFLPGQEVSAWSEISLKEEGTKGVIVYMLRTAEPGPVPVIIDIMTCSTSGGNREKGTDAPFAGRFCSRVAKGPVRAPGVNVRQVWARMASQLIAKAANSWGGRAVWIVQALLADYIGTHTALPLDDLRSPDWAPDEVNMVVSNLNGPVALYFGLVRAAGGDRKCWFELLGAPHVPTLESITMKLEEIPRCHVSGALSRRTPLSRIPVRRCCSRPAIGASGLSWPRLRPALRTELR